MKSKKSTPTTPIKTNSHHIIIPSTTKAPNPFHLYLKQHSFSHIHKDKSKIIPRKAKYKSNPYE